MGHFKFYENQEVIVNSGVCFEKHENGKIERREFGPDGELLYLILRENDSAGWYAEERIRVNNQIPLEV